MASARPSASPGGATTPRSRRIDDLAQGGQVADQDREPEGHRLVGLERGDEPGRPFLDAGVREHVHLAVVARDLGVGDPAGEHDPVGQPQVAGLALERGPADAVADHQHGHVVAAARPQPGERGEQHVDALAPVVEVAEVADDDPAIQPEPAAQVLVAGRVPERVGVDAVGDDGHRVPRDPARGQLVGEGLGDGQHAVDGAQDARLLGQPSGVRLAPLGQLGVG